MATVIVTLGDDDMAQLVDAVATKMVAAAVDAFTVDDVATETVAAAVDAFTVDVAAAVDDVAATADSDVIAPWSAGSLGLSAFQVFVTWRLGYGFKTFLNKETKAGSPQRWLGTIGGAFTSIVVGALARRFWYIAAPTMVVGWLMDTPAPPAPPVVGQGVSNRITPSFTPSFIVGGTNNILVG